MGCAAIVDRIQLVLGQGLVEVNRQSCPDSLFVISIKMLVSHGLLLPRIVLHEDAEIGSGGNELLGMTLDSESRGELVFALLGRMLVTTTPEPFYGHFGIHFWGYLSVLRVWHTDVTIRDLPSVTKKLQRFDKALQLDILELIVSSLNEVGLSDSRNPHENLQGLHRYELLWELQLLDLSVILDVHAVPDLGDCRCILDLAQTQYCESIPKSLLTRLANLGIISLLMVTSLGMRMNQLVFESRRLMKSLAASENSLGTFPDRP